MQRFLILKIRKSETLSATSNKWGPPWKPRQANVPVTQDIGMGPGPRLSSRGPFKTNLIRARGPFNRNLIRARGPVNRNLIRARGPASRNLIRTRGPFTSYEWVDWRFYVSLTRSPGYQRPITHYH